MSSTIPYAFEVRPDTGWSNGKLGMWLFLASEVMLFGALFAGYILLRVGNPDWPSGKDFDLHVSLASVNTLILLASSVALALATRSLRRRDVGKFKLCMLLSMLGGLAFLVLKGSEYVAKLGQGMTPASHNFMALYFTLTGLHVLHVVAGLAVNGYLAGPGFRLWRTGPRQLIQRVECSALYWYFVDLLWIPLFVVFYLL